jgi:hypothetical protein
MKLSKVNLWQVVPSSGAFSTACLTAAKGVDLTYEAGIVTAKHGDTVMLIPMSNVLSMTPLEAAKPAKK